MRNMNHTGELCAAEDLRDRHGDKLQPLGDYFPDTLHRVQHPDMLLNKCEGWCVRDEGTEMVSPKPRVPPRSCAPQQHRSGCPSAQWLLRFHAVPSQELPSSACSESAAAFSKHRLFLWLVPFPQAASPRTAQLRCDVRIHHGSPKFHPQVRKLRFPRRRAAGYRNAKGPRDLLQSRRGCWAGQERGRCSISRHSGHAQRVSPLHTPSPSP